MATTNINDDLKGLSKKLSKIVMALRGPILAAAAMDAGLVVERAVKLKAPVGESGAYRAGIRTEAGEVSDTSAEVTVGSSAAQTFALEFGSGLFAEHGPREKYPIEPDEAGALFWPGAGHPVMLVMHPGIESQPHFRPGYKESKANAVKAAKMSLKGALEKAAAA